jgi:hypothetical protein
MSTFAGTFSRSTLVGEKQNLDGKFNAQKAILEINLVEF